MVDDEINRNKRIDLFWIATQIFHRVTHGRQINDRWNAGEILHQNACGTECDFNFRLALRFQPTNSRFDIGLRNRAAIFKAQQVFEQYFQRKGKF